MSLRTFASLDIYLFREKIYIYMHIYILLEISGVTKDLRHIYLFICIYILERYKSSTGQMTLLCAQGGGEDRGREGGRGD